MVTDGVPLCPEVSCSRNIEATQPGATGDTFAVGERIRDRALVKRDAGTGAMVPCSSATQITTQMNSTQAEFGDDEHMLEASTTGGESAIEAILPCSGAARLKSQAVFWSTAGKTPSEGEHS